MAKVGTPMQMRFLSELKRQLKKSANPDQAKKMKAYMKSTMPYYGVQTPSRKIIFKSLTKDLKFDSSKDWEETVLNLWDKAEYREERYVAIGLTQLRIAKPFQSPKALSLYEHMIVSGAWWDYVDDIASHNVGPLLSEYPKEMTKTMLRWSRDKNMWKRRSSIICQLGFGNETDLKLLYACIEPSLDSKEFFLQKAIGWALRQYAWRNAKEIKRYVKQNEARLSNLSRREALKNL
jgi:3-methyladenine DNA glycosylase AlkD